MSNETSTNHGLILPSSAPDGRSILLAPCVAGSAAFLLYVLTLAPTVTSEDSGELIGAAYFFGVPHPPGYPLWTMLCGVFLKLIPFGCVAWRANLFSALCTSIAIGSFCRILILLRVPTGIALAGALICASGRVLWSQSVITEVYTLHFLVFILMVWCVVRWRRHKDSRWLCLASLLLGLGMSNHQTIGFTGVALTAWVLLQKPGLIKKWRLIVAGGLAFVTGLLPHVYMYVRANADPPINWGETRSLQALWDHVSRHQYRASEDSKQHGMSALAWRTGQIRLIVGYCIREFTIPLAMMGLLGLAAMLRRHRRHILSLWLILVICNVGLYLLIADTDFRTRQDQWTNQVFWLPVYVCIALAVTFGLNTLSTGLQWALARFASPSRLLGHGAALGVAAAGVAIPVMANYAQNNMRHYWYAYDHAKNILDTMLPDGIIFPSGDHNTFPLLYLGLIEGYRSDVIVADKYGYIDLCLYEEMPDNPGKPRTREDRDRIEEWVIRHAHRPVYYTVKKAPLVPNAHMVPVGILYHLLPDGKPLDTESAWGNYRYRNLEGTRAPRDFGADNILADWAFFQGLRELGRKNLDRALKNFRDCEEYASGIRQVSNNIGSALAEYHYTDEAVSYFKRAAGMDPDYAAPRWNLVQVYKSREQLEEVRQMFLELTEATPDDFRVWGELGFLAARNNPRSEQAIHYWQKSLNLNAAQPQIIEKLHFYYSHAPEPLPTASSPAGPRTPTSLPAGESPIPRPIADLDPGGENQPSQGAGG